MCCRTTGCSCMDRHLHNDTGSGAKSRTAGKCRVRCPPKSLLNGTWLVDETCLPVPGGCHAVNISLRRMHGVARTARPWVMLKSQLHCCCTRPAQLQHRVQEHSHKCAAHDTNLAAPQRRPSYASHLQLPACRAPAFSRWPWEGVGVAPAAAFGTWLLTANNLRLLPQASRTSPASPSVVSSTPCRRRQRQSWSDHLLVSIEHHSSNIPHRSSCAQTRLCQKKMGCWLGPVESFRTIACVWMRTRLEEGYNNNYLK